MKGRNCFLVIVILDSSMYVFELINIPYIRNTIIFSQMFYKTHRQLFYRQSYHEQTIGTTEKGSNQIY